MKKIDFDCSPMDPCVCPICGAPVYLLENKEQGIYRKECSRPEDCDWSDTFILPENKSQLTLNIFFK